MNDYGNKMSVLKEIYDGALMSRRRKTRGPNPTRKEDGDYSADEFAGHERKPYMTITLISGQGLPESEMLDEAKKEKAEGEEELTDEEKEGMIV